MYERITTIRLHEERHNFETKQNFVFKNLYYNFKIGIKLVLKFKSVTSELFEKKTVKELHCQAGPSRDGFSRIPSMSSERNIFCSMSHIEKINSFRDIALLESPIVLWKETFDSSSLFFPRNIFFCYFLCLLLISLF